MTCPGPTHPPTAGHRMAWIGCGATVRIEACDAESGSPPGDASGVVVASRSSSEALAAGGVQEDGDGGAYRLAVVSRTAAAGARAEDAASAAPAPIRADEIAAWLGEDGGPGDRSGLAVCADLRDAGAGISAAILPPIAPQALPAVLRFAFSNAWLFLYVEERDADRRDAIGSDDAAATWSCPLPNVLLWRPTDDGDDDEQSSPDLAAIATSLESADLRPRRTASSVAPSPPVADGAIALPPAVVSRVRAWRRWEALRRSIDCGTRWVLFEPLTPGIERRVEREVRAFLHDLVVDGVLPPWGASQGVTCRAKDDGDDGRRLVLTIRTELGGEFAIALAQLHATPRTLVPARSDG